MDPFAANSDQQQLNQQPPSDGMQWWFKWLIKGAAVILGCIALILGVVTVISISPYCIIAGLILMQVFFFLLKYFIKFVARFIYVHNVFLY
jgi:hypothetical protein